MIAQVIVNASAVLNAERKRRAEQRGKEGGGAAEEERGNGQLMQKLSAQNNRLKVSHLQALAEEGALEPGHEKCKWIRDAFDVEALASKMEENAQKELRAAIE